MMKDKSEKMLNENLLSPLCIVGSPRSGTTWLQKILLENDLICGGQESHFYSLFHAAFSSVRNETDARRIGLSTYWTSEAFDEQMRAVWINTFRPVMENKKGASVLLEKTPFHAIFIDQLADFLPKAKFIHLIRDSRSVTASLLAAGKGWGDYWAPKNTKYAALEWYRHVNVAKNSKTATQPDRYMEVHYEDLQTSPLIELKRIFQFVDLPFDMETMKQAVEKQDFQKQKKTGAGISGDSKLHKEPEGFYRKGTVDAWRQDLNWYQQIVVWRYTRRLMKQCGYNWNGRERI